MKYKRNLSGKERIVSKFLLENRIYEQLFNSKVEFVTSPTLQKLGVDLFVPGKYIFVDEKAAVNYVNTNLRNLVGDYINLSNNHIGWMADKKSLTTYLMQEFIILKDNRDTANFFVEDILAVDIMIIDFFKLRRYLDSIGWGIDAARILLKQMNSHGKTLLYNKRNHDVELRISKDYKESPAFVRVRYNVLVNKIRAQCFHAMYDGQLLAGFYRR